VYFAKRLKYYMEQRGFSKARLAREAGVSDSLIGQLLKEECNPSKDTITKIALALGISPAMFFIDEEHFVMNMRNFILPHLSPDLQDFVSQRDNAGFILLAQEMKASQLPADVIRKLITSYLTMSKPSV